MGQIERSYKKNMNAQIRALTHGIMGTAVDQLNTIESVRQAGQGSERDKVVCRSEVARMLSACVPSSAIPGQATLRDNLDKKIQDYLLLELTDGLAACCDAVKEHYSVSVFLGHLADEGLIDAPPGATLHPDRLAALLDNKQAQDQFKMLQASTDLHSPLLAACTRPARQALSRFQREYVAKFVSGDCSMWAWDLAEDFLEVSHALRPLFVRALYNFVRALADTLGMQQDELQLPESKAVIVALKNAKAPPPGCLRTFLLAKELRNALYDALMRMQRMLRILDLGNLLHATQRCGIAYVLCLRPRCALLQNC